MSTIVFLRPPYHLIHSLKLFKNIDNLQLPCYLETDEFVKSAFHLVLPSSLETDVSYIRKNDTPEQPLTSRFVTNAAFILRNNATVLKLTSSLNN